MATEVVGLARIREALEANEWAGDESADFVGLDAAHDEEADVWGGFEVEEAEMEREFMSMKTALNGGDEVQEGLGGSSDEDEEQQVQELERMMVKLQAVKGKEYNHCIRCGISLIATLEMSAGMPEAQRKKIAAKAVNDVMKSL